MLSKVKMFSVLALITQGVRKLLVAVIRQLMGMPLVTVFSVKNSKSLTFCKTSFTAPTGFCSTKCHPH